MKIAWIDLLHRTSWMNENCSDDLTQEAYLMLGAAEYCSRTFDWDLFLQDSDFACDLFDKTVWYRAIYMVMGMDFAWDRGDSWLPNFKRQLQWKAPWIVIWYDAALPVAAQVGRRLLWTWLMQCGLIEIWQDLLNNGESAGRDLTAYLSLTHPAECLPPTRLDCIIEIQMQNDFNNQLEAVRLTYRRRTSDEIAKNGAGVTVQGG